MIKLLEGFMILLRVFMFGSLMLSVMSVLSYDTMINPQAPTDMPDWVPLVWVGLLVTAVVCEGLRAAVRQLIIQLLPKEHRWLYLNNWCLRCKGMETSKCERFSFYSIDSRHKHGYTSNINAWEVRDDARENKYWVEAVKKADDDLLKKVEQIYNTAPQEENR